MEQTNKEIHGLIFLPCYSVRSPKTKQQNKKQYLADKGRDWIQLFVKKASSQTDIFFQNMGQRQWFFSLTSGELVGSERDVSLLSLARGMGCVTAGLHLAAGRWLRDGKGTQCFEGKGFEGVQVNRLVYEWSVEKGFSSARRNSVTSWNSLSFPQSPLKPPSLKPRSSAKWFTL